MADYDVRPFDDDGADHSNDFNATTDEGWFIPTDFGTLGALYPFFLKHYNTAESAEIGATGTGLFNPFLNMNGDSTLRGFNTNDNVNNSVNNANGTDISDPNTDAIQLGDIPIIYRDLDGNGELEAYYVINLDINENTNSEVSLEELQIYTSSAPATIADYHFDEGAALAFEFNGGNPATDFTLRFDLDATGENKLILRDDGAGQGKLDYTFYFPVSMFAGSNPNTYLTLFSQFGPNPADDAGFAEWNTLVAAKISGTKFHDRNGDGTRDADGVDNIAGNSDDEAPLAGFTMYIDINGNNKLDANEQTAITDANGNFTFGSLLPNASYVIREVLTSADVNGPGDAGTDVNFALYAPPAGLWDQTTDDGTGDQVVNVTTGTSSLLVGNRLLNPALNIVKDVVSITGGEGTNGLTGANSAGDIINYSITVQNTGNVTLTGVTVTDPNADPGSITRIADLVGDNDGLLEEGETWAYTATHTVTQAELDNQGGGDSDVDNIATADSDQTGPDTDPASAPLIYNPALNIVKDVASITGGQGANGLTGADSAGDVINYGITVQNTGNVTLTGVTVTDPNADVGSITRIADLIGDNDGLLEVGETWAYTATHTVTQAELDNQGGGDGDVDNIATADSNETGPDTDPASAPLIYNPALNIVKDVASITGGQGANGLTGADSAGDLINYSITVQNTGNVTLTGVTVTDPNADVGSIVRIADLVGDNDGDLEVGETWAYTATHTVTQAELDNQGGGDNDVDNIATADSNETGPDTDPASAPLVYNPALNIVKDVASITGGQGLNGLTGADSAGDVINYSITVQNTGNITLTGVTVTDPNADVGSIVRIADLVGDNDGLLEVGETWAYTATHTVTQAELDGQGIDAAGAIDGDGDVDNVATADSDQTGPDTDPASAPLIYNPALNIVKDVASITGGQGLNGLTGADSAGDVINYSITVQNTGNVTLTGVTVTDPNADVGSIVRIADLVGDNDGDLEVGETWAYTATHTVTQAELDGQGIDAAGVIDGDGDVDNVATADSDQTGPDTDPASAPLIYNPLIDIEKSVMTDVNGAFEDADDPDGPEASTSSTVNFRVVLTNTGNVTLTAIALADSVIHTVGGIPGAPVAINYSDPSLNAFIDLDGDETLDSGEEWANFDTNADGTLDTDENGDPFELSVGETVSIYYSLNSALGQHENTVSVTTGEAATDSDDANYYVLADEDCVGVRTPGFWSNPKWMTFWDGVGAGWGTAPNEPSQAGTPGFASGELLYGVDANEDGFINHIAGDGVNDDKPLDGKGLLVGDYNLNGITDAGEDTIFISLNDAKALINASSKQLVDGKTADGIYMLGRDVVAAWLNYLANNEESVGECIGDVDAGDGTNTPKEYLDAAIDWMQQFASDQNSNANNNLINSYHDGDTQARFQFDARIAPSSAAWQNPFTQGEDIPVSAAAMHAAIDGYNNTGAINGVEYCCDADSQVVISVLNQVALI